MDHISWNTTKKCNLNCKHCYRESGPEKMDDELTTEEGKELFDQMIKAGMNVIVLSGGEPMLRDDIFELITYAKLKGMTVLMGSNGTLITKEKANMLRECGLSAIAISIDSLDPQKHNLFRGSDTAFIKAIEGVNNCVDAELRVQLNCTITKNNLNEIEKIADFASELGAVSSHMLFLVDTGRGRDIKEVSLSKTEYKEAINQIIHKDLELNIRVKPTCAPQYKVESLLKGIEPKANSRGCIAGISYCSILPNGDVHICPYAPVKVASVREESFDYIWENNEVFKKLRDYKSYKGKCGHCKYINLCGGCRARAFSSSGDWLEEDPYCLIKGEN
ncbi:radical SAM protein [Tissierella sp. Yu-01]|uniref:radical SAM/SPASM domain-containing protein n=1 Tax=Tissierella sp. Yu-01 TaxID=3035694 RepID=UPI00240E0079|nr:radical SAM protein [Tissierella sp. Yu-01]WFA09365.1 radical SAM protein [Tissierella sp. Yu-01]